MSEGTREDEPSRRREDEPPAERALETERPLVPLPRCPYCHEDVAHGDSLSVCRECHAFHHKECFRECRGCASCGQKNVWKPNVPGPIATRRTRAQVQARRRSRRLKGALAVLFALLIGFVVFGNVRTWLHDRSPVGTAERYVREARTYQVSSKESRVLSRASKELLAIEDAKLDEPGEVSWPATELAPTVESGREVRHVDVGIVLNLVQEDREWKIERILSNRATDVPGARVRLPAGLQPHGEKAEWRRGSLAVDFGTELYFLPLEKALEKRELRAPGGSVLTRRADGTAIRGASTALFVADEHEGCYALALVEVSPGEPLRYEMRGPAGRLAFVERVFRESLATLEPRAPGFDKAVEDLPRLARKTTDQGFSILTPGGFAFGQACGKEQVDVQVHVGEEVAPSLDDLVTNVRRLKGTLVAEFEDPKALLPKRSLFRVEKAFGGETFVLSACGVARAGPGSEPCGIIATAQVDMDKGSRGAALSRLVEIVDSFAVVPETDAWPSPASAAFELPGGATFRPPRSWTLVELGGDVWTWKGFDGDRLSLTVVGPGQSPEVEAGSAATVTSIGGGRRAIFRASARPERLSRVIDVMEQCKLTLRVPEGGAGR
ncbi:hypothetical protein HY251_18990 [bacterium]|nr:hypothetical protein [bacterium]